MKTRVMNVSGRSKYVQIPTIYGINIRSEPEFDPVNGRPARVEIISGIGKGSLTFKDDYDESTSGIFTEDLSTINSDIF